jgi:hypothetical protein
MDDTNASQGQSQSHEKAKQLRSLGYLAIGLTLVVALLQLWGSLHGKPSSWPEMALLITLFCASMAAVIESRRVKMMLAVSGIVFALVAIYGLATGIAHR